MWDDHAGGPAVQNPRDIPRIWTRHTPVDRQSRCDTRAGDLSQIAQSEWAVLHIDNNEVKACPAREQDRFCARGQAESEPKM